MDHAGNATQVVVEKVLLKQNIDKKELGRVNFLRKVKEWKEEKGRVILNQLALLGASFDWSRSFFTMDQTRSNGV